MHSLRVPLLCILGLAAQAAQALAAESGSGSAPAIVGCWISEAGTSVIEIVVTDGVASGHVVGLSEPHFVEGEAQGTAGEVRVDVNNPEPELRGRPVAGMNIVRDLLRDDDEWVDGRIYDPEGGRTYAATGKVNGDGTLALRGYVGSPMFGRTTKWTPAAARPEAARRMLARTAPLLPPDMPTPDCAVP